ncbi:MAG: precorrin-8X methylmutase [Cyanobacteria bacterium P01_F01_bin.150]
MNYLSHPITEQSFAIIDREIGAHTLSPDEYKIVRRVIHSTADFEFKSLVHFSHNAIKQAIMALRSGNPIITDVNMVKQGIKTTVQHTFGNPIIVAVDQVKFASLGKTRTELGMLSCLEDHPTGIFVIGNAPTALMALCRALPRTSTPTLKPPGTVQPSLTTRSLQPLFPSFVIGAPVGFVAVEQSKEALAQTVLPHIRVNGRKGGSPVAAAILNALLLLAWEQEVRP